MLHLQHATTQRNSLQLTAALCNTLPHTVSNCNTLEHTATHCSLVHATDGASVTRCNTTQLTAIHCNTLQHTHLKWCRWLAVTWLHVSSIIKIMSYSSLRSCLIHYYDHVSFVMKLMSHGYCDIVVMSHR